MSSFQSIHSRLENEMPRSPLRGEQLHDGGEQPELPEMWDLKDPFIHAPPKPNRDPWSILLEPLMEKDRMQCEAWKDEVQNLLIFAGLFSAVVTAFIIESYKRLQPDPNDAVISLLSVIANRLDNTTYSASIPSSSTRSGASFSPTNSSLRVNSFWFISLVLSLATVLFGIISLQWIREHQNYPKLSRKETYALFNMRADGLERWHVPMIFNALPLLLQSALILFLGGIIDFLWAFGGVVVIPVSIVTVLVLLLLVATTLLPTLQGLLLCLPYPYTRNNKSPPAQCPYKSPQAHAFRAVLSATIPLYVKIFPDLKYWYKRDHFPAYIWIAWITKTWTEFDIAWLQLRDAFMQRSYRRLTDHYDDEENTPVFDLTQGLMASVQSRDIDLIQNSLAAQYHCFTEISKRITGVMPAFFKGKDDSRLQSNAYLRDLMIYNRADCSVVLSDFINLNTFVESQDGVHTRIPWADEGVAALLHQENMFLFLRYLRRYRALGDLFAHMLELTTRLSTIVHIEKYEPHASQPDSGWPICLAEYSTFPLYLGHKGDSDLLFFQWVNNFSTFFQGACRVQLPDTPGGMLYTHPVLIDYIAASARVDLHRTFQLTEGLGPAIQRKFLDIFQFIAENLNEQMSSPDFYEPSFLFYVTALYLRPTLRPFHHSLDNLILTMQTYKERTIDAGIINHNLEDIYGRDPDGSFRDRFSSGWWDRVGLSPTVRGGSIRRIRSISTTSLVYVGEASRE